MGRCSVNTTMGTVLIEFDGAGICKLVLPSSREDNLCSATEIKGQYDLDRNISLASRLLERYFLGEEVDFGPVEISIDSQSSFYRKVCKVVRAIPYGHVMTYGDVAKKAGSPGAARAVGRVMATNSMPVLIPCHRVVAASGALTGYSAAGGIRTKEALLKMEEMRFTAKGAVEMKKH